MTKDALSLKKPSSQSLQLNLKINQSISHLPSLGGAALNKTLNLDMLQPELNAKMNALSTETVNTGTIDRFINPIQGYLDSFVKGTQKQTDGAVALAQGWWQRHAAAKAEKRAKELANLLMEAQQYMQKGEWKQAIKLLDKMLKLDSQAYIAFYFKAICLGGMGQFEAALKIAADGSARCEEPELKQSFQAITEELRNMIVMLPALMGVAALQEGKFRQAIVCFNESLSLKPRQPDVLYYKAMCHFFEGEFKESKAIISLGLSLASPDLQQEFLELGEVISTRQALKEAEDKMSRKDFSGAFNLLKTTAFKKIPGIQVPLMIAICAIQLLKEDEAKQAIEEIERRDKSDESRKVVAELRDELAFSGVRSLVDKAVNSMRANRWQEALDILRRAESQIRPEIPNHPLIHYYIAICYLRLEHFNSARDVLVKARSGASDQEMLNNIKELEVSINIAEKESALKEAVKLMGSGKWTEAKAELLAVTRRDKTNAYAWFYIAICHVQLVQQEIARYNPSPEVVLDHIRQAKLALTQAQVYRERGDSELQQAISQLISQLP